MSGFDRFLVTATALVTIPLFSNASTLPPNNYQIHSKILEVKTFDRLELENIGTVRLWGVTPKDGFAQFIDEHLIGAPLRCDITGTTANWMLIAADRAVQVVDCTSDVYTTYFAGSLQEYLLEAGVVDELCSESLGQFQTCVISQD